MNPLPDAFSTGSRAGRGGTLPVRASLRLVCIVSGWALAGCKSDINIIGKAPAQEEEEVVSEAFEGDWGQWLSMGVLPDGRPVAAFYDATDGALGFAIATIGEDGTVAWSYEQADGYADAGGLDTGDRGKYVDMVVAASGDIWLAYQDVGNENLRYARRYYLSGEWESGVADSNSNPASASGMFASIALDGSGIPVIAHHDGGLGELRVAHWEGTGFQGEVVDEGSAPEVVDEEEPVEANVGLFPSLQIVDGIEYIAYHDQANGDLLFASGTAGAYTLSEVATEGNVGAWPDLVIESGTMHIAFHDVGNQDLMFATGTVGSWSFEVVDDGEYVGADSDLLFTGGTARIAYYDGHNNDLKLATRVGDSWSLETRAGAETASGFFNELVETGGRIYGGCYDYTNRSVWFSALN
ncbi:MAG TPA: hypothetical protein DFR83_23005 [Deltaproteobacteria bacterium]|nr:hypothetical protein [Deltaproteobacteria bacterium]